MWGGRFDAPPDPRVQRFTESISFDWRLLDADLRVADAHAAMLRARGLISAKDLAAIRRGVASIRRDGEARKLVFDESLEDIHTHVEHWLRERVGAAADKLHTARSRNDLVSTDLRLWMQDAATALLAELRALVRSLAKLAARNVDAIMPGYTHLQRAQPVTFAHVVLGYAEMLLRDRERIRDAAGRANRSPLGAGAIAGTTLPITRASTARALGFSGTLENSIDAVSDRDFVAEFVGALAILAVHLSRIGEDLVLWSTTEFGFVAMSDAVTTGSSLMPQKRNPDVAELVRGKAARVIGAHVALLTLQKGLPLAYNRDLQEDKEACFDAFDSTLASVECLQVVFESLTVRVDRMRDAARDPALLATDLAEALVLRGVPFRKAHETVGRAVRTAETGRSTRFAVPGLTASEVDVILDPARSVRRRHLATSIDRVRGLVARESEWRVGARSDKA
ncbi:MAG: argininosuccinate lyase [Deltaproteobacteria bacterium]|nr:argininosuccinate lyase [Deltaproteobacteria bacterium]